MQYDKELTYVVNDNDCWVYALKARDRSGYSMIKFRGRTMYGHVYNYLKHNGPLLPGEEVRHGRGCDRACIRPSHLAKGSRQDNIDDKKEHAKILCKVGHELNSTNSYKYNGSLICKRCKSEQLVEIARRKREMKSSAER